ncbi:MAG TPA: T9SS type A sorting domain-containing protein [bacterium]|jgi:hypothetical protein
MKHSVALVTLMLLLGHLTARADGYRLDVGHFDPQGPLTVSAAAETPLADGCLGQILVDMAGDGINVPDLAGNAGKGDALLTGSEDTRRAPESGFNFAVNGGALLTMPGSFLLSPGFAGATVPRHRIYLRVWNAPEPSQATGYWDSPLYTVLPGNQQVSFLRSEWCFSATMPDGDTPVTVAATQPLQAFPNPFNSSSRISFALQQKEHVRLVVYDLTGRLVTTLMDGPMDNGRHDFVFDGTNLPTGLYFLRLQAGKELSQVTRLLLIR